MKTEECLPCAAHHLGLFVANESLQLFQGRRVLGRAARQLLPTAPLVLETRAARHRLALHSRPAETDCLWWLGFGWDSGIGIV